MPEALLYKLEAECQPATALDTTLCMHCAHRVHCHRTPEFVFDSLGDRTVCIYLEE